MRPGTRLPHEIIIRERAEAGLPPVVEDVAWNTEEQGNAPKSAGEEE